MLWKRFLLHMRESIYRSGTFLGIKRSAIFETVIALAFIVALSHVISDGTRFIDAKPHPFWIVMLLIVIQYGVNEALMAAVLCTVFLLTGNLPKHIVTETTYGYLFRVSFTPFLWVASAIIIGGVRTREIAVKERLQRELTRTHNAVEAITDAYNRLKGIKESLETRLAGELRSAITAYEAAKSLESLDQTQILLAVEDVIVATMSPRKFSIYALGDAGFEPAICYGWEDNDHYVRRIGKENAIYEAIAGRQKIVCAVNEDDEKILAGQGLLAGPLIDSVSGNVFGMMKIEELGLMEFSVSNIETFKILCEWIGVAYGRAGKYQSAKADSVYNEEHMLYSYGHLQRQTDFMIALARRLQFNLSRLTVKIVDAKNLAETERKHATAILGEAVKENLRQVDQLFDSQHAGTEFVVLLPGTPISHIDTVIEKIKQAIKERRKKYKNWELQKVRFSYSSKALYEANDDKEAVDDKDSGATGSSLLPKIRNIIKKRN